MGNQKEECSWIIKLSEGQNFADFVVLFKIHKRSILLTRKTELPHKHFLFMQLIGPNLEIQGSIWSWPNSALFWKNGTKNFQHPIFNPFSKYFA